MTFKSFLVLEPKIIEAYTFSYAMWGKWCLSRKLEVQTYFVLSLKAGTVRKTNKTKTVESQPAFFS